MKASDKAERTKSFCVPTTVESPLSTHSLPALRDINRREALPLKTLQYEVSTCETETLFVVISDSSAHFCRT